MTQRISHILPLALYFCLIFLPFHHLEAQVQNPSFEQNDSTPSFAGWQQSCTSQMAEQDAPPSGGSWCVRLQSGSTQGCFPAYAYQTLPAMQNGDIWTLSAWLRTGQFNAGASPAGIQFGKVDSSGTVTLFSDITTDPSFDSLWTQLTHTDTIWLNPGDTGAVFLNPGTNGGPIMLQAFYDLVDAEKTGLITAQSDISDARMNVEVAPNPFVEQTQIRWEGKGTFSARLWNVYGQVVRSWEALPGQSVEIAGKGLGPGIYFFELKSGARRAALLKLVRR